MNPMYEDASIWEIDGIAAPYMELRADGDITLRWVYRTLAYIGDNKEQVTEVMNGVLEFLRTELKKAGGGTIIWRLRPTIHEDLDPELGYRCKARARLATSPFLPEAVWNRVFELRQDIGQYVPKDLRTDPDFVTAMKPVQEIQQYEATG